LTESRRPRPSALGRRAQRFARDRKLLRELHLADEHARIQLAGKDALPQLRREFVVLNALAAWAATT
jgi:hypothetical protein